MFGMPEASIKAMYLIRTHYIMRVIEFHPEDQTVDLIQDVCEFCNTNTGNITVENELGYEVTVAPQTPIVMYGIPVKQERWGQFSIQACPKAGDTGYIEVFTNDITDWIENGGISIPGSDRHFARESCIFVPFVPNKKNADANYVSDENTLVIKSANASITLTDDGTTSDVKIEAKTMTVNAENGVSITGNTNITGNLQVTGDITAPTANIGALTVGSITSSTAAGTPMNITGTVDIIGSLTSNGVSLSGHTHPVSNATPANPALPVVTTEPTPIP